MSFALREESRYSGEPLNLYRFKLNGGGGVYRYTDAEQDIDFDDNGDGEGGTYQSVPLDRGALTATGTFDKSTIEIRISTRTTLVDAYRVFPPSGVMSLTIWQGHAGDGEFLVVWVGRVLSISRQGEEAVFACEPISTALKRPGLRRNYQYGCPHALYGAQCRAAKVARPVTVVELRGGNKVVVSADGDLGAATSTFVNGMLEWTPEAGGIEIRNVFTVESEGDNLVLTISGLSNGLAVDDSLNLFLGCDHTLDACKTLHDNILNFGGQPWIPLKNPIGVVSPYL